MFSTHPGGQGEAPDASDRLLLRHAHDDAAFHSARVAAERECLALLVALHSRAAPMTLLRDQARTLMSAAGLLWESSARLADE